MLRVESEKRVPSSSQSCGTLSTVRTWSLKLLTPVTNGTLATLPAATKFCGVSVKKTPSTRGSHVSRSDCAEHPVSLHALAQQSRCHGTHTWAEKKPADLSTAALSVAYGTSQRHWSVSDAAEQPVSDTSAS